MLLMPLELISSPHRRAGLRFWLEYGLVRSDGIGRSSKRKPGVILPLLFRLLAVPDCCCFNVTIVSRTYQLWIAKFFGRLLRTLGEYLDPVSNVPR